MMRGRLASDEVRIYCSGALTYAVRGAHNWYCAWCGRRVKVVPR